MFYFLHKYRIPPTVMQLNAFELIYDVLAGRPAAKLYEPASGHGKSNLICAWPP
jgi:hypothetical protein